MTLLVVDNVTIRHGDRRHQPALTDVSLDVAAGETVSVMARRQTTRALLVRACAGIVQPERGSVRFRGEDLRSRPALGNGISVASRHFDVSHGRTGAEQLEVAAQHAATSRSSMRRLLLEAAEVAEAADLLDVHVADLDPSERFQVGFARALVSRPEVLLALDPTADVGILGRDLVERLLGVAAQRGVAVLVASDDILPGARVLSLHDHDGQIAGDATPAAAPVTPIRRVS